MNKTAGIILGVIGVIVLYLVVTYNGFVSKNASIDGQFAQVESQYQRRFDLIPNLVSSVKGAMSQEEKIFTEISNARSNYANAKTSDEKVQAINNLDSSLSRLIAISENYPTLKSIDTVTNLMTQLEGTENRIAVERMRYNELVTSYNISVKSFPGSLLANLFNFKERSLFKSEAGAEKAPQVDLTK